MSKEKPPQKIRCDCCGKELMAEIRDGKLIILQHRHGKQHFSETEVEDLTIKKK